MSRIIEFTPTADDRDRICEWLWAGLTPAECAKALGLNQRTLRRHFPLELKHGREKKRAELVTALFAAGRAGNASAIDVLRKMQRASEADQRRAEPPRERLGVKARAARDAETAGQGTDWANLLTPPGMIDFED